MHQITVVSLGNGARAQLTIGALERLRASRRVILRTGLTDAAAYLREQGIAFETLDALHEECEDFDELIARAAETVARAAGRANVVYAVLDALSDETAAELKNRYPDKVVFAEGASGALPFLQAAGAALPVRIAAASSLAVPSTQDALLVTELSSRLLAGECKLKLAPWYGDEAEVLFFPPSEKAQRGFERIPLCELDRQKRYDHTAAVYIPCVPLEKRERCDMWDLVRVLRRLRGQGGDPWDQEQTHRTLTRYLIEEAYEVSEAVESGDWAHVADELGDVLLQVVFQADIGAQYGTFTLDEITTDICRKMIERHAGIFFGGQDGKNAEEIARDWERMKQRQRGNTTRAAALRDVSTALPALRRAEKIFGKAVQMGLDTSLLTQEGAAGELLMAAERLRKAGKCPEEEVALLLARFVRRVEEAENNAQIAGKSPETLTSGEINVYLSKSESSPPRSGC